MIVINCNHWIGYHIINTLLENDYNVKGLMQRDYPDDLLMFFGRNSSFSLLESLTDNGEPTIVIGEYEGKISIENKIFWINPPIEKEQGPNITVVRTPLIFGEWMPMNEKGCYLQNRFIPFHELKKEEDALYAGELANRLLDIIKGKGDEKIVKLRKELTRMEEKKERERQIQYVIKHYQLFKPLYIFQ